MLLSCQFHSSHTTYTYWNENKKNKLTKDVVTLFSHWSSITPWCSKNLLKDLRSTVNLKPYCSWCDDSRSSLSAKSTFHVQIPELICNSFPAYTLWSKISYQSPSEEILSSKFVHLPIRADLQLKYSSASLTISYQLHKWGSAQLWKLSAGMEPL